MDFWAFAALLLANCLVSAAIGWWAAGQRYAVLAYHVSSMEAAVTTYWDRIRKRMRIEPVDGEVRPGQGPPAPRRGLIPLPPELQTPMRRPIGPEVTLSIQRPR